MSIMSGLGSKVSKSPKITIAIILVLTLIFTYFGSSFVSEADPESFNPDHELIRASEDASDTFGTEEYNLLVIVKADDKNILDMVDIQAMIEFEDTIRSDVDVGTAIMSSQSNPTGFNSLADMVVLSWGLYQARAGINLMLQNLITLAPMLENPNLSNGTKAQYMEENITFVNGVLNGLQNGNNGMFPQFNKTSSLLALDGLSFQYGANPVPTYMGLLQNYNATFEYSQTLTLTSSVDEPIDVIKNHTWRLSDPVNGSITLATLETIIPGIGPQLQNLDGTIVGLSFGMSATLTKDFGQGGTSAKGSIININFDVELDGDQRSIVENRVHDVAVNQQGDLKYGVLGNQLINDEIQETMDVSQIFLLMLVFVLIILILFGTFRSGFDTVLTLMSLGMAIIWSYGIAVLIGLEGSIISTVVPILLVGLGVDYGIHMTMRFREEKERGRRNNRAIAIAIGTVGMALLLATITTGIGFMSNTVSSLTVLRDFAIMVTAGIVASFVIMTTFLPAVRLVVSERRDRKGKVKSVNNKTNNLKNNTKRRATSAVTIGAKAADRAPWAVLLILVIISGIAGYGASQLDTVFDFREFIPRDTEAYDNYVFLIDEFEFGDVEYGEFYITGDVANPDVLKAMNNTVKNTYDDDQVLWQFSSRSILSVAREYSNPSNPNFNVSFAENWTLSDTDGDGIPDADVTVLFDMLYSYPAANADVMSVVHKTGNSYDAAIIQVRVNSDNLKKADVLVEELDEDAAPLKDLEGGTLENVYVIGEPVVINVVVTEMNEGQIRSIIITIAASFIVLTIVFFLLERSFILGAITMIPVLLVILWILGTMLIFGYNLNVMTITLASLTVGMGITYSIHVSERFTEDLKRFKTPGEACENTLTHTGMALAGAFLTTSGGFGVLYFHKLPPIQQFGVMIALSIAYSFLASAYVLPTFLILWAKWRKNYRAKRGIEEKIEEGIEEEDDEIEEAEGKEKRMEIDGGGEKEEEKEVEKKKEDGGEQEKEEGNEEQEKE